MHTHMQRLWRPRTFIEKLLKCSINANRFGARCFSFGLLHARFCNSTGCSRTIANAIVNASSLTHSRTHARTLSRYTYSDL